MTAARSRSGALPDILAFAGSRVIPSLLFSVMVVSQAEGALRTASAAKLAFHVLSGSLWALFTVLVNVRPAPLRRDRDPAGVLVALVSQLSMITVGLFGSDPSGGARLVVSDALLVTGLLFSIASVAVLGRCFGVLPDVRGLVTRGPYRLVRHPLYLGELTAALGIVAGSRHPLAAAAAWVVCLGLQLARTRYEERNLRAAFPEYEVYAGRTRRLVPGIV